MPERLRRSDLAHDMNGNVKAYEVKIRRSERSKGVVTTAHSEGCSGRVGEGGGKVVTTMTNEAG